jgi:hypothetical protein
MATCPLSIGAGVIPCDLKCLQDLFRPCCNARRRGVGTDFATCIAALRRRNHPLPSGHCSVEIQSTGYPELTAAALGSRS